MKLLPLLVAGSLALNAALLAWFALRPANPPVTVTPAAITISPSLNPLTAAQANALKSGDPAQMKAAGVPDEVANILAAGRAYANGQALDRAHKKLRVPDARYWRNSRSDQPELTEEQRAAEDKVQKEFSAAMERAFPGGDGDDASDAPYSYLPPTAREKLARIEKDYDEIEAEIYSHTKSGIQLPSDLAKLKLLEEEKRRDIAAALTPAELGELQLHDNGSETVQTIRSRYGDAIPSEADYRKIFALQKAYDDRFSSANEQEISPASTAANAQLRADILAIIGEENYASFQRANDEGYRILTAITERLQLPSTTPGAIYAVRDGYALQAQAINGNAALTDEDQRTQLIALGEKAHAAILTKLGPEGATVYTEHTEWLDLLKSGSAFSTNPKDAPPDASTGTTVYPLPNPRR